MIPKIIHYCWLGDDPFPPFINKCLKSWNENLSDYEFILWDKTKYNISQNKWVEQACHAKKYAFAADYIRFYALYHYGGIYLDADVQVIKPFNELLINKSFIGLELGGDFEAAIIGSEKGSEWLKKCLDYYEGKTFIKENGQYDMKPLPSILNELLLDRIEGCDIKEITIRTKSFLTIYSSEYFSPKNIHNKVINKTINTYCVHHFDGKWLDDKNKDIKYFIHRIIIKAIGINKHNNFVRTIRRIKNILK